MTSRKWIYRFGAGASEGHSDMKDLLGNKGANLAEMAAIGLPVPPGFTITTDACRNYLENSERLHPDIRRQIDEGMRWLEKQSGRHFGDPARPLLVSVRSGAAQSMPGMMDTVLNLGLNDENVAAMLKSTKSRRFILDCYRRLIEMYSTVVLDVEDYVFDDIVGDYRIAQGLKKDIDIDENGWKAIIEQYKQAVVSGTGKSWPQNVEEQFFNTIGAVFRSWYSPRAIDYRNIQGLDDVGGTAVTIQLMVYGNRSKNSASGVAYTRDPSTGEPGLSGEYLPMVQGEDIVDGFHSPRALTEKARHQRGDRVHSLEKRMPDAFRELVEGGEKLEQRFRDAQEIEFTIEKGKLWFLQTRAAKRTIEVAVRIALDLMDEGLVTEREALARVPREGFDNLTRPVIDPGAKLDVITRGLPASPGADSGKLVFSPDEAVERSKGGEAVVLVRNETSPEDVRAMHAAKAILTRRGGMSSHAADIARAIGRPCVVDARFIEIDADQGSMKVGRRIFQKGDEITIDGSRGLVLAGIVPVHTPELDHYGARFKSLLQSSNATD